MGRGLVSAFFTPITSHAGVPGPLCSRLLPTLPGTAARRHRVAARLVRAAADLKEQAGELPPESSIKPPGVLTDLD